MEPELSVSLVRNRRIIDARTLRRGGTLRIPRSRPVQLELNGESETADDVVFDFRAPDLTISLPDGVLGEIASGTGPRPVSTGTMVLDPAARGWLALGETTLLVQRLPPLPPAPRTKLPAAVRSPWARLEKPLAITLAVALVAEGIFVALVHRQPDVVTDDEPAWSPSPPVVHVIPPQVKPVADPPQKVTRRAAPAGGPATAAKHPGHPVPAAVKKKIDEIAALFGNNPVFDPKTTREVANALELVKPMGDVSGPVQLAAHRPGTAQDGPVGIGHPWEGPSGPVDRPTLVEHPHTPLPLTPSIDPPPPPDPAGPDDDYAHIVRAVRRYAGTIQHCYEIGLRLNQQLRGKVVIEMNVVKEGTISEVEFPEGRLANDAVMTCLSRTVHLWKMPALTAHDELDVEFPFVFNPASGQ
jgi:hypothetical protein